MAGGGASFGPFQHGGSFIVGRDLPDTAESVEGGALAISDGNAVGEPCLGGKNVDGVEVAADDDTGEKNFWVGLVSRSASCCFSGVDNDRLAAGQHCGCLFGESGTANAGHNASIRKFYPKSGP